MNTNKKSLMTNNGWILCPSKTFSGKMYYFNVQTGEAVWTLGDNEKFTSKKGTQNVQQVNSYHNYPEPTTSPNYSPDVTPANICPSTSNICPDDNRTSFQKNYASYANQPIFGQPPRFVTQLAPFMPGMPNVVWTPIQLPTPRWPYSLEDKKPTVDRITQTSTLDRELFVQTSGKPLCQRFVNYEIPLLKFNEKNKIINRSNNFVTSTPIKDSNSKMEGYQNQPILNMETESFSSLIEQSTLDSSDKTEICEIKQFEIPHNYCIEKQPLCSSHKVQYPKLEFRNSHKKDISKLHSSDLRFLLMAKRKKLEEEGKDNMANKKPKVQAPQTPQKKKVTFNFENLNGSVENAGSTPSDQTPECKTSFYKITMSPTQTMLNYYNMLEHKIPVKNNVPNHNVPTYSMPTRNIPTQIIQNGTATNQYVKTCQNNMPINIIPNKNNLERDMTIKRHIANYTLTGNKLNENTLKTRKCDPIKDDNQNHPSNPTLIYKKAPADTPMCNNPIKNLILPNPENSENYSAKTITTFKKATNTMPFCNTPAKESVNFESTSKEMSQNMPNCNTPIKETANCDLLLKEATKNIPDCNTTIKERANIEPPLKEVMNSCIIKDVWYLVVDIDVLLEDLAMVDQLLMSDEKCKLLIPQCIRKDIEALCIGDCRGQQRVLVARQLSRRMSSPGKQCIVIPPNQEDIESTTTDAILNTCTRFINDQYYVVLITNDADLYTKAKTLHIRCYKPQEIKNRVQIRPQLFSELKKIKVTVENHNNIDKDSVAAKNNPTFFCNDEKTVPVNMFKKQLFVKDKQIDNNYDILINITKPKNDTNPSKFDNNLTTLEIKNNDENIILRDSLHSPDIENHASQNNDLNKIVKKQQIQNNDTTIYKLKNPSHNLENAVPNSKTHTKNQNSLIQNCDYFQNENFQNIKMAIDSTPLINNRKVNDVQDPTSKEKTNNSYLQKNEQEISTTKILEKLRNTVSSRTLKINSLSLGKFKIPKLLPLKNRTNTSALKQSSNATENNHSNFKLSANLEGRLKNFYVKSKMMHDKIETRMNEWTCIYSQIMEDLLNDILQASPKYKDMNISASNIHESLTCIKMLYNDEELRNIVELLVQMLDKCSCSKGKIKLDTKPKDFIKIVGCGVLLVEALKAVLPTSEILTDYGSYLNGLLANIESKAIDLDPEPLRSSIECRNDIEDTAKEDRLNFLKDPTYIIEYLKKHYKEWASYDETQETENGTQKYSSNEDFTVVRMIGKNLNRVKIDSNKCISYAKSSTEKEYTKQDETKMVKLSQNYNHPAKDNINQVQTRSMLRKLQRDAKDEEMKKNAGSKIIRLIENVSQNIKNENDKLNVMRNIEIKEEPLDLDLLDYEVETDQDSDKIIENTNSIIQDTNKSNENSENVHKNERICEETIKNNENYATRENNYANENDNYGSEVLEFDVNTTNNDNYANNQLISRDGSTNDSGIENDCAQAHSIIKIFLMELSNTFKVIYEFITNFVIEIRGEAMCEERKNHLHVKSSRSLQDMIGVTQQLRSIMKREFRGRTKLKRLLHSAGTDVPSNNRISRYKQIITKCLEQAKILENSLRSIVSITIGGLDALSTNADSISSGVKYINIFE